jgi:PAS domain-containing protein
LQETSLVGARVQDVFQFARVQAAVLDVLASGATLSGVLIPLEERCRGRVLCASLSPVSQGSQKPRKVLLQAYELEGRLVIDEKTGRILEANEAAARMFAARIEDLVGQPVGAVNAFRRPGAQNSLWDELSRKTSVYLGKFIHAIGGTQKVEVEAVLLLQDA